MNLEIGLDTKVVVAPQQVAVELSGELVILNTERGEYFGLNTVGASVWNYLQTERTVAEIRDRMLAEYPDAGVERCTEDTVALIRDLIEAGLTTVMPTHVSR